MQTLFAEHGLMRRHPPAAAFPDGGFDVLQARPVQPDAVGQIGGAEGLVTARVLPVAGGAYREARLGAGHRCGHLGLVGHRRAAQALHVQRHVPHRLVGAADGGGHGRHLPVAAVADAGENGVGAAAVEPVVVGQVRVALGAAGVRAVAQGAVVGEQAAAHVAGLRVGVQLLDGYLGELFEQRRGLFFHPVHLFLPLAHAAPVEQTAEPAQPRVQHQIDHREQQGQHEQVKPPARQRLVAFLDAVKAVAGGVAAGFLRRHAQVGEQQKRATDQVEHHDGDDVNAPEVAHGRSPFGFRRPWLSVRSGISPSFW